MATTSLTRSARSQPHILRASGPTRGNITWSLRPSPALSMASGITNSNLLQPVLAPIHTTFDPLVKEVFIIKGKSMLDAIFTKKSPRARGLPAYVTTTVEACTVLWKVGSSGNLTRVGKIQWKSETSDTHDPDWKGVTVRYNRTDYPADSFGRRSKALLGKRQAVFTAAGRSFIWQQGLGCSTVSSPVLALLDTWKCVAIAENPPGYSPTEPDTSLEPLASGSTPPSLPTSALQKGVSRIGGMFRRELSLRKEVLIRFIPPQAAVIQGELAIDAAVLDEVVPFLISAILLVSHVDDWKKFQSSLSPQEVEATLMADRAGSLPAYSNASNQTERATEAIHPTLSNNSRWRWNGGARRQDGNRRDSAPP